MPDLDAPPRVLHGIGVGPGLAAGPVARMASPPALPDPRPVLPDQPAPTDLPVSDPDRELADAVRALEATEADLRARADAATGEARDILSAQAMIAADPTLREGVAERVRSGDDAPHALRSTFDRHREILAALGGYLGERAADLDDIAHRAIAAALGRPMPGLPAPGHPFVLIADDLAPADTVGLDPETVLALVTERGGPTSHTAILARALGLPAVVGCAGILDVPDGTLVTVDGTSGRVGAGVGEEEAADVRARAADERSRLAAGRGPGRTADGHPVDLMVNIGSAADLRGADLDGVTGVGLFRTEFLFLDRRDAPGLDEQVTAYAEVFSHFPEGTVVVRTLDAGADKPLPFLGLPEEPNPALGVRGLRVARDRPGILDTQLAAIARAAERTTADVWVMAPMVSTPPEAADFVARARAFGLRTAGVMVEVPAAALRAERLVEVADFLSVGTNDLSQYTLAADRQSGALADLLDPWQPALLQLIATCADAGRRSGRSVGVCGEAAADPALAPVLVGLGVTKLSMSPRSVPAVRARLAAYERAECEELARRALDAADAAAARAAVLTAGP
ncbi:phosphoenolpyruvate--protein phosphotransferase [Actinoallomurus purpureus]|uniref:phosphoenolpyruvate--protein phosphotransferase n=1 Tax=Actinoallomurus purpureus TaxID=478114 RepID=UPI002093E124|nr:phosphoenolpyruvate--protein phosphotransferase [Actinoallomurus purpureus]MCO6009448.1 phosphoenolpyruvate--protein phosphotransferase [Actinoallomurus purpureus]